MKRRVRQSILCLYQPWRVVWGILCVI